MVIGSNHTVQRSYDQHHCFDPCRNLGHRSFYDWGYRTGHWKIIDLWRYWYLGTGGFVPDHGSNQGEELCQISAAFVLMGISRKNLYILIMLFCVSGYSWLVMHLDSRWVNVVGSVCVFKKVTGIPCPSCGATRSMIALISGDLINGVLWNPIGLLLLGGLVIFPFWLLHDLALKKNSFHVFYASVEKTIRQKRIAWPLIVLVLLNWCWNIYKGV